MYSGMDGKEEKKANSQGRKKGRGGTRSAPSCQRPTVTSEFGGIWGDDVAFLIKFLLGVPDPQYTQL